MGKKSKTPKAPDYTGIAQQQASQQESALNKQIQANRPDQVSPFGSVTWEQDGNGNWLQNTSFAPDQQNLFNAQTGNQQTLAGVTGNALRGYDSSQVDFSGAPNIPGVADYGSLGAIPEAVDYGKELGAMPEVGGYNQQVIDTMRQLQAPDLAQRRGAQDARLAAMGLGTGSGAAWESAQRSIGDTENRADLNAVLAGINQGNTQYSQALAGRGQRAGELGQTFNQGMAGRQQGVNEMNTQFNQGLGLRQQGVSEQMQEKQANLAQLGGLMSLGRAPTLPISGGFMGAGQAQTPDMMNAAQNQYNAQMQAYNAQQASNPWNAIAGLAGTVGGAYAGSPTGGAAIGNWIGGLMGGQK